jgi:methylated-DNA-[protein]-cysteine S-methyltransferase
MDEKITMAITSSPLGGLELTGEGGEITALNWIDEEPTPPVNVHPLAKAVAELHAYFAHDIRDFTVSCSPAGDAFERTVWTAICDIPYGATSTYGDLAAIVGKPARAVGGACGRNPIPIIIPCHRVIGAGGRMVGYSGKGGVETKQWLLQHEGALLL